MSVPPDAGYRVGQVELVWLTGADRLAFLERMSTNRLADLASGTGRATAILTDTGRVVDLVACHVGADGVALLTSGPAAAAAVTAHLRRYVMYRDRVRVTDASAQVDVLRVLGHDAAALADAVAGLGVTDLQPGGWRVGQRGDHEVWALRHPAPGGLGGVDLVAPRGLAGAELAAALAGAGAIALTDVAYARQRIAARLPAFGAEVDGRANPLELGLRDMVDFSKGCYVGQEVVARLDAYDKVQLRLVMVVTHAPVSVGAVVRLAAVEPAARPNLGRVTTVAPDSAGGGRMLALIPAAWPPTADVVVDGTRGAVAGHVVAADGGAPPGGSPQSTGADPRTGRRPSQM